MTAVEACHPALAEHERVTGRLNIFWYQALVVFTIEEDVGEGAKTVLDPIDQRSSRHLDEVAHEAAPVLGRGENLGADDVLRGPRQGAERAISLDDLEQ